MTETENITEVGPIDQVDFDHYEQASGGMTLPLEGKYTLKFADVIDDSAFYVKSFGADAPKFLEFNPMYTIVGLDDFKPKFSNLGISTQLHGEVKQGIDGKWKPTGKTFNSSDAADLLIMQKSDAKPQITRNEDGSLNFDQWKEALASLAGQTTLKPVRLTWAAYDGKAPKDGSAKRNFKYADFPAMDDGSRPPYITRINEATGEERTVYARLVVARNGFRK